MPAGRTADKIFEALWPGYQRRQESHIFANFRPFAGNFYVGCYEFVALDDDVESEVVDTLVVSETAAVPPLPPPLRARWSVRRPVPSVTTNRPWPPSPG
jgi:hypothetical protein